jgi:hypothetical protein
LRIYEKAELIWGGDRKPRILKREPGCLNVRIEAPGFFNLSG